MGAVGHMCLLGQLAGGQELHPFRQAVMPLVFRKGRALGCCVEAGLEVPGWQQGSNPEAAL